MAVLFYCVTCEGTDKLSLPLPPFSLPAHPIYISRVRGETSISLDQSLIRPETPNTHKAKFAILMRLFFSPASYIVALPPPPPPTSYLPTPQDEREIVSCIGKRRFANWWNFIFSFIFSWFPDFLFPCTCSVTFPIRLASSANSDPWPNDL